MSDGALTKTGTWVHDNGFLAPTTESIFELFSLRGKTAIVTGAAAGIGYAAAQALAEAGANVAICYNTNNQAHKSAAEIETRFNVKCGLKCPLPII
jgi:sorbose reductase